MKLFSFLLFCIAFSLTAKDIQNPVTIYVDDSYPPYSYLKNNQLRGIYPSILQEIKNNNPSLKFDIKAIHWKAGKAKLKAGAGMSMFGFYYQVAGHSYVKGYSLPVHNEEVVLVCAEESVEMPLGDWPRDFHGKLVANVEGYSGWLRDNVRSDANTEFVNFLEVPDTHTALKMVVKGKIDCALFERLAFKYELEQLEIDGEYLRKVDKKPVVASVISKETVHVGYVERLENCKLTRICELATLLDAELTKLKQSGTLKKIIAQQTTNH